MIVVRPADLDDVRRIRRLVLRPGSRPEELVYAGDAAPGALHLGGFDDDELVSIASIGREPPPGAGDRTTAWRLRGMATLPPYRGRGIGGRLLEACVEHARSNGASSVWCNARVGALSFYARHGFASVRGPFEIAGIGPHHELDRPLR